MKTAVATVNLTNNLSNNVSTSYRRNSTTAAVHHHQDHHHDHHHLDLENRLGIITEGDTLNNNNNIITEGDNKNLNNDNNDDNILLSNDQSIIFAVRASWFVNILLLILKLICYIISGSKSVLAALADSIVDLVSQIILSLGQIYKMTRYK